MVKLIRKFCCTFVAKFTKEKEVGRSVATMLSYSMLEESPGNTGHYAS